ncbi:thiolase family protein [Pseudonocardia asaccharolytica]|uniref:propanoyl-CoA C-acyltransferase n=1 Tax=Pseudonocardia asaccharolytica DSM 44247 = NBRC 16224 TaxID=1123024 RepID=A0A511D5E3_9PSEU|nr:thiolase family protein [Pseudonocardia asaccharolytica]GEL20016.1 thiolase [Pseudonocardia asaccharolytica DSM 44247 = NBRC 16224]
MREAYVVAVACTSFGKHREVGFRELARQTLDLLVADAGPAGGAMATELDSLWFGNCFMGAWGQENLRGQMALVELVDEGRLPARLPVTNVEGACATGSLALHGAVRDVRSGEAELAVALGIEKLVLPEPTDAAGPTALRLIEGCTDNLTRDRLVCTYQEAAETMGETFALGADRSLFMDTYATQALLHMKRYGTTREQLAASSAKNHNYGALNPLAQYRFTTTLEDVLADREVAYPLTRSMCSPVGDGAAAALVCSGDWLAAQPAAVRERAVRVRATAAAGGTYQRTPDVPTLSHEAARRAYHRAGLTPSDVDVAEVHDATSFGEILQVEMLGFCPPGHGGAFVADGATGPGGSLPVNTSGGLVSKGHPIGATGLSMAYELTVQLRGEAGARQVPDARIGLAENGGGVLGLEEATCAVTILERTG